MTLPFSHVTIDGLALRTARAPSPGRPTVIVTNAFPQSIRCWESLWSRLAERFDVLAVDLAGFGRSEGRPDVMRPSKQAALLVQLMDASNVDRAFVVGPDVGVPVSLWLAAHHPDRVAGINVYDGPGTWPADFDPALGSAVHSGLVRWLGTRPLLRRTLMVQNYRAATAGGYVAFRPSDEAASEYRSICFDPERHRNAFQFLGSYHEELPALHAALPDIHVPVLVTWGARDPFVPPSNGERMHELLPNSELTVFPDAGHFSHEDADDAWLERFTRFVRSHAGDPSEG